MPPNAGSKREKPSESPTSKAVKVDTVQCFSSEEYGEIEAGRRYEVSSEVAARWLKEGKALPVIEDKAAIIETPEEPAPRHETAAIRHKKETKHRR